MENANIDITHLINIMGESFERWAVNFVYLNLISNPFLSWLALPILSTITKEILKLGFRGLTKTGVMLAFFQNTALRKAGQASDYVKAVQNRKFLEGIGTRDEFKKAELDEISKFNILVRVDK